MPCPPRPCTPSFSRLPEYPEIVAALKLTEEQKTKLRGGARLDGTLGPEQQKAWNELLGEPFAGPVAPPFPGGPPSRATPLGLTQDADAAADLKLTPEQSARLREVGEKYRTAQAAARQAPAEERAKKLRDAEHDADEAAKALLTEGQRTRLGQLRLRQVEEGPDGLAGLLGAPDVVAALGLTRAQQDRIKETADEAAKVRAVMSATLGPRLATSGEGAWEKFAAREEEWLKAALTETQRAKLKDLLGEPLKRSERPFRGGPSPFAGLRMVPGFAPPTLGPF
jgi:hypothetical protein